MICGIFYRENYEQFVNSDEKYKKNFILVAFVTGLRLNYFICDWFERCVLYNHINTT